MYRALPNVTNTYETVSVDSLNGSETNTFGKISLFSSADTTTRIEFPVKKGCSTLEITPEDLGDTVATAQTDTTTVASIDTAAVATTDTAQNAVAVIENVDTTHKETVQKDVPFTEFDDKVFRINYTKIGQMENGWMFWTLLASLIVLGITKIVFKKRTESIFSHAFNFNFAQKEFHKSGENSQLAQTILQCIFAFNLGLFTFFAFKINLDWELTTLQTIIRTGIFTGCILVLYFCKKLLYYLIAGIFDRYEYAHECIFNVYLFNRALGICLYPIVIALAFVKPSVIAPNVILIIGYVVIGLFYMFRLYREFQISLKNHISLFYIFLYFCTLEFLPIMLLVKFITSIVFTELHIV